LIDTRAGLLLLTPTRTNKIVLIAS